MQLYYENLFHYGRFLKKSDKSSKIDKANKLEII